jgi:hypothetical protein
VYLSQERLLVVVVLMVNEIQVEKRDLALGWATAFYQTNT